jgi:hypothetical protein
MFPIKSQRLSEMLEKFKKLEMPDQELTEAILWELHIHDIIDLVFCLNKYQKRERDATLAFLERYIPDLTSGDLETFRKTKSLLREYFYQVDSTDEEAML